MAQKRGFNEGKRHFPKFKNKKQKTKSSTVSEGSNEEVLLADIQSLLKNTHIDIADEKSHPPALQTEIDIPIAQLSSTGDGLGIHDSHVYVVPFSAPGDIVRAKAYKHEENYSLADFISVVKPSEHRSEVPRCQYFSQCSGCQFQFLPYAYQLLHKRRVVEKAYQNFSRLPSHAVPTVGDTIGSPLQYGYRTKLTPHFDGPPGGRRDKRNGKPVTWPEVPPIGFMLKGTRKTMDIEDCPIGTESVRRGMRRERKRVEENIHQFQKGATLLLRENTRRIAKGEEGEKEEVEEKEKEKGKEEEEEQKEEEQGESVQEQDADGNTLLKTCITNQKSISTEYVDGFRLDNPAGAFFQNNNSILPLVTQYIRSHILGPDPEKVTNMIDAYCGSGFFTITLSQTFTQSIGIDISAQSIDFASHNARRNNLPESSTHFIAADANALFAAVDTKKFPPEHTAVVVDPPRKGCDEGFIRQLMKYGPERICYVSCNVHTQARDVGWLVGGLPGDEGRGGGGGGGDGGYEIESLRGFDFFPMTSHVEGVAILRKKAPRGSEGEVGGAEGDMMNEIQANPSADGE